MWARTTAFIRLSSQRSWATVAQSSRLNRLQRSTAACAMCDRIVYVRLGRSRLPFVQPPPPGRFFGLHRAIQPGELKPPDSSDQVAVTTVETARLDDYVFRLPLERMDRVKLAVEGGEREVLDATTQARGYEAREIILMLRRFDFERFDSCSDRSLTAHRLRDHHPDIRNCVAVPKEKCAMG